MNRVNKSAIDWAMIYRKVGSKTNASYRDVKGRHDNLVSKIAVLPDSKVTINWDNYRKIVPFPGFVDKMKKEYESFTVPEPKDRDNWIEKLKINEDDLKVEIAKSKEVDDTVIKFSEEFLESLTKLLPKPDECSWEMIHAFYPELTIHDKVNPPFLPIKKETQEVPNVLDVIRNKPFWRYD